MNIQSFAMIYAAYLNPAANGDLKGVNNWVWIASHVLADQKFITIFSMLFGAGILLMSQRLESRGGPAGWLHFRRTLWLLVLGLGHAYLVWHSDILVTYAICAVVVYFFRRTNPVSLTVCGLLAVAVPSLLFLAAAKSMAFWPPEAVAGIGADWCPSAERAAWEIEVYRGSWLGQMTHRVPTAIKFQTFVFAIWTGWRAGGLMLLGMACMKWGIFTAQRPARFYFALMAGCAALGFPLIAWGVERNIAEDWAVTYSMFTGSQFNYWGSLFVAFAYVATIMLFVQSGFLPWLQQALAAVGRTALTNYLGQSLLATFIFYGHGLGLFGKVERWQQLLIVFGIWIVEVAASVLWLRRFQFGPIEWLWRSLTYWRLPPMRATPVDPAVS